MNKIQKLLTKFSDALQIVAVDQGNDDFFDPLRASDDNGAVSGIVSQDSESVFEAELPKQASLQNHEKEWTSFKRFLMQRFPVSKMVSVSSVIIFFFFFGSDHTSSRFHILFSL